MINIRGETYEQNKIETLFDHHERLWLNETHIGVELGYSGLQNTARKYYSDYRKYRFELIYCKNPAEYFNVKM